ncbi:MAG: glycosyltransferase family 4 protein [Acidimicrobiales bacterium]
MRIALVCPYSLSVPGGVQGQVLGSARALEALGHEVTVLAPADAPVEGDGDGDGRGLGTGTVVTLGRSLSVPANGSVAPVSLDPFAAGRALRIIGDRRIEVVHLHEPLAPGAGWACLWRCRRPMVGTFHRSGASTAYRLLGPLVRRAAARLAVRCAVSPEAGETASQALGGSYEIVGNGVEEKRFAEATPWPTDGPTVLFIGRHEPRKGLGVLLEAFGRVVESHPTATLWIVGSGPETEALRARTAPERRVQWLGRVDDDELAARLRGADVLCAPSLGGESFGMILIEAMAARTAVVASDIPGYSYVARGHARLGPPGDVAALAENLSAALADAVAATATSSPAALDGAQAHAAQWSMGHLAERYGDIYASVADVRQSGR